MKLPTEDKLRDGSRVPRLPEARQVTETQARINRFKVLRDTEARHMTETQVRIMHGTISVTDFTLFT